MSRTLVQLHEMGIDLSVDGEHIRVEPKTAITDEVRRLIREHKTELIAELQAANDPASFIHWRECSKEPLQILWQRVQAGEPIRIYSDTLGEAVCWVRDETLAAQLKQQETVCYYTLAELKELAGKPPDFLRDVHQLKKRFSATLKDIIDD